MRIADPVALIVHRLRRRAAYKLMYSSDPGERDLGLFRVARLDALDRRAEREGVFPPSSPAGG